MGLYDRDYTRENFVDRFRSSPQMRMGFQRTTPIVKRLLIINVVIFIVSTAVVPIGDFLFSWFSLFPATLGMALQPWRLVTYQFLHGDFWHILLNMWALWMFGPNLERTWDSRKFLFFYLGCGAAGGLFYIILVAVDFLPPLPMVGASGAILGVFTACAILFPGISVFFFPFPVAIPIRLAATGFAVLYVLILVTRGANAGGHAAHIAGVVAGAVYVFSERWRERIKLRITSTLSRRRTADQQRLQFEVDRVLKKVHDHGIQSLTSAEKRTLRQATKAEQMRKGS
jgi:membrane associated rhomboid family serine protease